VPHSLTDLAGLKVSTEDFLAAVLEDAAQPIWVVDPEGRIRFANPAALAALGYDSAEELLGCQSHETIHFRHPDGTPYPAAECPMLLPRATGETISSDLDWFVRRDGSMVPVSYVSAPIQTPEGRGAVVAFTNAEDRVRAERLRREYEAILAAQRRLATLVAGGAASADVFAAIAREVAHVVGLPSVLVWRYEPGGTTATVMGAWSERPHPFQAGTRWPLDGPTIVAAVLKTARPARIDAFADVPGTIAAAAREAGIQSVAGAPIIVDGDLWGVMATASADREPLPDQIEDRLAGFTELVATAISNTASRAELARLADEQAALRRVATLVARGVPPPDVFAAVAREVGLLLGVEWTHLARYEPDGTSTALAGWSPAGDQIPVGTRINLDGESVARLVLRTARPARMHDYANASGHVAALVRERGLRVSAGAPIVVDQRLWGVLIAASKEDRALPVDAESRIAAFSELVATAISNAEARTQVGRLAEEQAALRRVATLVARGVPQSELFGAVTEEVGRLLPGADLAGMGRQETDGTVTVVATWAAAGEQPEVGGRWRIEEGDPAALILKTPRAARIDDWNDLPGPIAEVIRALGIRSSVAIPILVDGCLWGALAVHTSQPQPLPLDTESRLENFTELVATAISNIQVRSDLAASRARIVAATDEERRRVVRDLHDGAQQRLVHTILTLKTAQRALQNEEEDLPALLTDALENAEQATGELRELAHGILPGILAHGGLRGGVDALASRTPVPVEKDVSVGRLPAAVEATAYFVIAEALTNVAKHSRAGRATVTARVEDGTFRVQVRDDGIGGARPGGSGLLGLADRLAALDGQLRVESPADGGTLVAADIPLPG
jgi:PAS domain S-box-containing protein